MFENFKDKFQIDQHIWEHYTGYFHKIEVPSKTILLQEGEYAHKLYVVEKGCVRAWFNHQGKDLTFQFFLEHQAVSSIESFRKHIPSPVAIETIEPSVLWCIAKDDVNKIIEEIKQVPELLDVFIAMIFQRTFDYMNHFFSFIKDTPQQRYLNLMKERPEIIKRIPQHYIASFLGISTVHLSRIKSQIAKS